MSHHTAALQASTERCNTLYNASLALSDQLLWIDDAYFQPFVRWAVPRLWSLLVWLSVTFVRWVQDTLERFMDRDLEAVALATLSLLVPPMRVPLALPSGRPPLGLLPEARMQTRVLITPPPVQKATRKRKSTTTTRKSKSATATRNRKTPQKKGNISITAGRVTPYGMP